MAMRTFLAIPATVKVSLPALEHWKAQVKCQSGCPVATDAGRYVQLISEARDEEAYLVARAPNPFASVCGRVCAAPCEDACRRGSIDAPIAIVRSSGSSPRSTASSRRVPRPRTGCAIPRLPRGIGTPVICL
jgi:hypothetical protein